MATAAVTLGKIDQDHRQERASDHEKLRTGQVTPQALQEENSFLPASFDIRFVDFEASLQRVYGIRP